MEMEMEMPMRSKRHLGAAGRFVRLDVSARLPCLCQAVTCEPCETFRALGCDGTSPM